MKQTRIFLFALVAITLLRLAFAAGTELIPEEAYYWTYSQHPSLGYFDHPPMVAWCIKFGTIVFGDTELGVRCATILLAAATGWLLVLTGRIWFNETVAVVAGWIYLLLPVFAGAAFIVTPDAPLLFFWMFTVFAISKALATERIHWWLIAGGAFGGAMLSKYYGVLLAGSLFIFLLRSKHYRVWLQRPQPWLASLIALIVFSPVIIWNAQHDWASFAFQSTRTVGQHINVLREVSSFWITQLLILTPTGFALLAWAFARGLRHREDNWQFAVTFAWPIFALFALAAFKTEIHINWTAPAFLTLSLPAAVILLESRIWRFIAQATGALCVAVLLLGHVWMAWHWPNFIRYERAGGWRAMSLQVEAARTELTRMTGQHPFILGADKYNLAAIVGFYTHNPRNCVNTYALGAHGLGYRYWQNLAAWKGRPAVVVMYEPKEKTLATLRAHFEKVDPVKIIHVTTRGRLRSFCLVNCYGYRPPATESSPE